MGMQQLTRHQLYDEPMPLDAADKLSFHSGQPSPGLIPNPPRSATLKFADEDRVHQCAFLLSSRSRPRRTDICSTRTDGARSGDEYHSTQVRADGSHMHLPPPVPDSGDLSSAIFTSPPIPSPKSTESGTFSAARSGSVFSTSAYADPYSTTTPQENLGPGHFPRSPGRHILPSSSTPRDQSLSSSDSTASVLANATSPTRHRFALPSFPRARERSRTRSDNNNDHRGNRPKGPADLEEMESEALVSSREEDGDDEGEDGSELGGRLEKYDTRDQL